MNEVRVSLSRPLLAESPVDILIGNFCFDPQVLKRAWVELFSTPKRSQNRQHTESESSVS